MVIFRYVLADAYGNEYATEMAFYDCPSWDEKDLWIYGVERAWSDDVVQKVCHEYGLHDEFLTLVGVECVAC